MLKDEIEKNNKKWFNQKKKLEFFFIGKDVQSSESILKPLNLTP
jgi:hypothetical protein